MIDARNDWADEDWLRNLRECAIGLAAVIGIFTLAVMAYAAWVNWMPGWP